MKLLNAICLLYIITTSDYGYSQCIIKDVSADKYFIQDCSGKSQTIVLGVSNAIYGKCGTMVFTSPLTNNTIATKVHDEEDRQIIVYPNPTITHLNIDWKYNSDAKGEIISLLGQVLYKMNIMANSQHEIDVSILPPGYYQLKINSNDNHSFTYKIIKI
jgi:hypothetical protein